MNPIRALLRLASLLGVLMAARLCAADALRLIPAEFSPSVAFEVTVATHPDSAQRVQAVSDTPPAGWSVAAISHGGSLDPLNGSVKWGPFLDALPRTLTYRVNPPANASGLVTFSGQASFDAVVSPIGGRSSMTRFPGTLERSNPGTYLPGTSFVVTFTATPASDVEVWALEESVPPEWAVSALTDGGVFDAISRKVKWGPYIDAVARNPSYTLMPPSGARSPVSLSATVRFGDAVLTRTSDIAAVPSRLVRSGPADYVPGVGFTVELTATPAPYVRVFAVEEEIPAGWTPAGINLGGTYRSVTRSLRWGPFIDPAGIPSVLSYHLVPAAGTQAPLVLSARGRFDDADVLSTTTIPRHLDNPASLVRRTLPGHYVPGMPTTVSLEAIPIDTARVYAVEEVVPAGWTTTNIASGGSWDAVNRTIKWGPFFDGTATVRSLVYEAIPPADAFGRAVFGGTARFDVTVVATSGDTTLVHSPPSATRSAPPRYTAGVPFDVTLALEPVPGVELQAVEERIPSGWTASGLTDGGSVDPNSGKLKWGPFIDRSRRTLTYRLMPSGTAAGTNSLGGTGHFNREALEIGGARALAPNAVPVAVPIAGQYRPGQTLKIPLLRILAAASDADGDLLRITSATSTSDAGGDVHVAGSFLFYSPPAGYSGIDHARVRIEDPYGGGADATVDLVPVTSSGEPTRALISITTQPGGMLGARFAGVPGRHYRVQSSDTLTPPIPWNEIACATAGSDGQFIVTDTPPGAGGARYYRLVSSTTPCN